MLLLLGFVLVSFSAVWAQEASVSHEAELLAALGKPSIGVIHLLSDIQLSASSRIPGTSSGIYHLTRNVTISGAADGPTDSSQWYPTLDLDYVSAKLGVPAGLALTFHHVLIRGLTQQLGTFDMDVIEHTSLGTVIGIDAVHYKEACVNLTTYVRSYSLQANRPPVFPGNQSASLLPNRWCNPPPPSPASNVSSGGTAAAGNASCYPSFSLVDVALNMSYYDLLLQSPMVNTYFGWMRNSTYICHQMVDAPCIAQYGSAAQCWKALLNAEVASSATSPLPDPSQPAAAPSSGSSFPGWIIGVVVGGVAALAIAAAVTAVVVVSRRCSRRRQPSLESDLLGLSSRDIDSSCHKRALTAIQLGSDAEGGNSCTLTKQATPPMYSDSFDVSTTLHGGNMYDECWTATAATAARPPPKRVDAGELVTQMATKSAMMRDEQLELIKVLGRGGGGIVYQGLWKGLQVAAKVMIVHEEQHDQSRRQILEATMSTSLSHPNIVITYNYDLRRLGANLGGADERPVISEAGNFATAWQLIILQELCKGGAMRRMMNRKVVTFAGDQKPKALTLKHVLMLAHDVSSGLEHLHSKNVVHSDMTANNVLLQVAETPRPAGLQWVAKVADFGLSNAIEDGRSQVSHIFAGTPHYIAPETQSQGVISKCSDVFAFGILLYEMMVGSSAAANRQQQRRASQASQLPSEHLSGGCSSTDAAGAHEAVSNTDSAKLSAGQVLNSTNGQTDERTARGVSSEASLSGDLSAPVPLRRGDSVTTAPLKPPQTTADQQYLQTYDASKPAGARAVGCAQVVIEMTNSELQPGGNAPAGGATSKGSSTAAAGAAAAVVASPVPILMSGSSVSSSSCVGSPSACGIVISPTPSVLMGGGRGQQGGCLALTPLPSTVPPEYVALVEACLSPLPQDRPTIPVVRRRLAQLVEQYVMSEEPSVPPEGITISPVGSGAPSDMDCGLGSF